MSLQLSLILIAYVDQLSFLSDNRGSVGEIMLKTIDVTLNEQQVALVLGMIWECREHDIFDESESELVKYTEALFADLENKLYSQGA
jgi:hypothetical protein